jgi:hypothetical protein
MMPKDPTDPDAIAKLAAAFDLQMETWKKLEAQRGAPNDETIEVLLPRGNVRLEDLGTYRVQLGSAFQGKGALVFHVDGKEVYRRAVDAEWPTNLTVNEPLPAEVKSTLKDGSEATWGFHPEQGSPVTASFKLVEVDLAGRVESIRQHLAVKPLVARQLVAQLYLSEGLAYAAYEEARPVVARRAHAIMQTALSKMGLEDSWLWNELRGSAR